MDNKLFCSECGSEDIYVKDEVVHCMNCSSHIVDTNKKPNARERYLAFKSVADEHFGGLDKSITEYIEGLEEVRKLDNQIITNMNNEIIELRQQLSEARCRTTMRS